MYLKLPESFSDAVPFISGPILRSKAANNSLQKLQGVIQLRGVEEVEAEVHLNYSC